MVCVGRFILQSGNDDNRLPRRNLVPLRMMFIV